MNAADQATFIGIVNGRPRFDFGDSAPLQWLLDLVKSGKVDGNQFLLNGQPIEPGTVLRKP